MSENEEAHRAWCFSLVRSLAFAGGASSRERVCLDLALALALVHSVRVKVSGSTRCGSHFIERWLSQLLQARCSSSSS